MAELKNMTVQALRDLARKALGRGHSKLKTKTELIEALQAAQKKVAGAAEKAASKVREAAGRAARVADRSERAEKGAEAMRGKPREPARAREKEKGGVEPRGGSKAGQAAREAARAVRDAADAARAGARRVRAALRGGEREPDPEGYIVARVAGEAAARGAPHPMTESAMDAERRSAAGADLDGEGAADELDEAGAPTAPGAYEENLGELPWAYGDDTLMALPRDPSTLFFYWDHAQETLRHAWEGLEGGRPQLWVFVMEPSGAWTKVRAVDFALESRSYYIHDLEPGRVYRAEIHVVDRAGRDKLLPKASNEMMLPPVGPSPVIDDRFMRILWSEPLQRLLRDAKPGGAFPEDVRAQLARLSDWSRFQSTAGGGSASAGAAGGIGGRPASPWARPTSGASSPWGGQGGEGR
jgi:uncharacterized protein